MQRSLERLSAADSVEELVAALDEASESVGFEFGQLMLVAPIQRTTTFAARVESECLVTFDRAVVAASDHSSPYDHVPANPESDPVVERLRQSSSPVVWDPSDFVHAGLGDVRDWLVQKDRAHGVSLSVPLVADSLSRPLHLVLSVQRREAIRSGSRVRTAGSVALIGLSSLTACTRVLAPLLVSSMQRHSPLTPTMRLYLRWAEQGKTARETAAIVGRQYSTVKNVIGEALERIGCSSKVDALRIARKNGWL